MKVKDIMTRDIEKIDFNSPLSQAAEKMRSSDIGVLPVEKDGKIIGIITDRDIIIRGLAMHLDPETTTVSNVMTSEVATCYDNDDLEDAISIMEEKQIRRLVVFSRSNEPAGILTIGDLAIKADDTSLVCRAMSRICESVRVNW